MDPESARELILDMPFMPRLPQSLRETVIDIFEVVSEAQTFSPGESLFREGQYTPDDGFVVLSGTIAVNKANAAEMHLDAPILLGEMKQFNPASTRTANVDAVSGVYALRFSWDDFNEQWLVRLKSDEIDVFQEALEEFAYDRFAE